MLIDEKIIRRVLAEAQGAPRLRQNFDLRTSPEDSSQRMLNALLPGTQIPIHRHLFSSETVVIVYGSVESVIYDDNGHEIDRMKLSHALGNFVAQIPKGAWHTVIVTEPCVIFEAKDGAFTPLASEDIMNI